MPTQAVILHFGVLSAVSETPHLYETPVGPPVSISAHQTAFLLCCCRSLYLAVRSIKADTVPSCPGGSSQRGHVHHHPRAPPLTADGAAAGAAGVRPARGLRRDAEEAGALPRHHREPPAHRLVLAESGGVHQRGAGALPALRLRPVQVAFQPG